MGLRKSQGVLGIEPKSAVCLAAAKCKSNPIPTALSLQPLNLDVGIAFIFKEFWVSLSTSSLVQ